jgi:hypothetical protein
MLFSAKRSEEHGERERRMDFAGGLLMAVPVGGDAEVQGDEGGC